MQRSKICDNIKNQKEEGDEMIVQVLAIIMAFILGILTGIAIIIAIAFHVERREQKNGGKKEAK